MIDSDDQRGNERAGDVHPRDTAEPMSSARDIPVSRRHAMETAALPKVIGRYHIIEKIGEGGMGLVMKAEQRAPVRRIVAVKLIKLGLDSASVLARFQAEQQALALMDHPNIAKVLDAGITESGRAYFVMEYIPGEPITRYCDRQQMSIPHRLELFRHVCSAVQHAHTKGVIHRDLKPDNVLVSVKEGEPSVKVIDFGVAKAIQGRLSEQTYFTEQGQIIGTPEYMSPEQAEMNHLEIDTRTDVYGLGVMLYELLAGCVPFDSKSLRLAAYGEIQRIIREQAPPRLSTRLSSLGDEAATMIAHKRRTQLAQLASQLHGELGWIPLKALRKDRTERYQTAAALEQDIENYLDGRPLIAGPESALYRARKFFWRNKGTMIATVAAVIILLGGALVVFKNQSDLKVANANAASDRTKAEAARRHDADTTALAAREHEISVKDHQLSAANALRAADGMVASGDALALSGAWGDAKQRYEDAVSEYRGIQSPALRADLAILEAYFHAPPPLCVMTQPSGIAEKDPKVQAYYAVQGRDASQSLGQHESIESLAFSSDGRRALTGVRHCPATLWDVQMGRNIRMFNSEQGGDRAVAWTPDGRWALSGGSEGTLTLWDANSGKAEKTIRLAHLGKITAVAISPDATRCLSYGTPRAAALGKSLIKFWDLSKQTALQSFAPADSVSYVALSPDNRSALSALAGGSICLWDLETGKEIPRPGAQWAFWHFGASAFSASGQLLCAHELTDTPGIFRLFEDRAGTQITQFPLSVVTPGTYTADGRLAVMEGRENSAIVFDLPAGREHRALTGHTDGSVKTAITPDGRMGLTGSWDMTLRTWALTETPQILRHASERGIGRKTTLSPDGRLVLQGGSVAQYNNDYKDPVPWLSAFEIWDAATGRTLLVRDLPTQADGACWSPNGSEVALACRDGLVRVWDVASGRELKSCGELGAKLHVVAFSPDGKWLASGGDDKHARIFDTATGIQRFSLDGLTAKSIWQLVFSPDSSALLAGDISRTGISEDTHLKLWNTQTGALLRSFASRDIANVAFSPDGMTLIVATSFDGILKMDAHTGKRIGQPWKAINSLGVAGIGFSPDGSLIAAGHDQGVCILSPSSADPIRVLKIPPLPVNDYVAGIEFSADRRSILVGSRLIDISWPARYRELRPAADAAFKTLQDHPDDGAALKVVGEWYAFNGVFDWAAEVLEKARANGANVAALTLGQCYWRTNQTDKARAEYTTALRAANDKDRLYLQLCLGALESTKPNVTRE